MDYDSEMDDKEVSDDEDEIHICADASVVSSTEFLNMILSNPWPLKIKPSNTMLATLLLVYCLE